MIFKVLSKGLVDCFAHTHTLTQFDFHPKSGWTPIVTKFAQGVALPPGSVASETLSAFTTYLNSFTSN